MSDTDVQALNTDCKPNFTKTINWFFKLVNHKVVDPGTCRTW